MADLISSMTFLVGALFGFFVAKLIEETQRLRRMRENDWLRWQLSETLTKLEIAVSPDAAAVRDPKITRRLPLVRSGG